MAVRFHKAELAQSAPNCRLLPEPSLPEVAFIGRSNVGKSSLLNALLGRKSLARTSSSPGKTREFVLYRVDDRYLFVDLPGFGYAKFARSERERWQKEIGRYVTERKPLRIIFHLVDARHDPTPLDREVMRLLRESTAAYVILLTKSDKLSGNQREKNRRTAVAVALEEGLEMPVVLTSAKDGRGLDETRRLILELAR
jgi:GTP-binding protein